MPGHAINSLSTECRLLITFANRCDRDQARQNVGPDLHPICLTLRVGLESPRFYGWLHRVDFSSTRYNEKCRGRPHAQIWSRTLQLGAILYHEIKIEFPDLFTTFWFKVSIFCNHPSVWFCQNHIPSCLRLTATDFSSAPRVRVEAFRRCQLWNIFNFDHELCEKWRLSEWSHLKSTFAFVTGFGSLSWLLF